MRLLRLQGLFILVFFLLVLGSCTISDKVGQSGPIKTPDTFIDGWSDSVSVGYVPRKEFFKDSNLVGLIDTALHNNINLQMAMQRIEMAKTNFWMRRRALLPTGGVVLAAGVEKFGDYTMDGVGNFDSNLSPNTVGDRRIPNPTPDYFIGLRSTWEVDIWRKLRSRKKAAFARLLASQRGKQLIETALVAEVANLYYRLLALDNKFETLRENINLQEKALELISIQKLAGKVTELAVKQFEAQLLNTKSMEAGILQEIVEVENQLNFLLGRYPQPVQRGSLLEEETWPKRFNAGIPSQMLLRRPDIQQAELEIQAAKADVYAARAAYYPSLTISPYVGLNSFGVSQLFNAPSSLAYGIIAGLGAPIFNRNQIKGNYSLSVASNRNAIYSYQNSILKSFQEVVTDLRSIENFNKVVFIKQEQVEALQKAVSISNDLFLAGYASYLEVVMAQKNVLEAELELTNAKKDLLLTKIDLYRSLGGGWE